MTQKILLSLLTALACSIVISVWVSRTHQDGAGWWFCSGVVSWLLYSSCIYFVFYVLAAQQWPSSEIMRLAFSLAVPLVVLGVAFVLPVKREGFIRLSWADIWNLPGGLVTSAIEDAVATRVFESELREAEASGLDPSRAALESLISSRFVRVESRDVQILADGRVVGLASFRVGRREAMRLYRLQPNGKLDGDFVLNGVVERDSLALLQWPRATLEATEDGRLLVCEEAQVFSHAPVHCLLVEGDGTIRHPISLTTAGMIERIFLSPNAEILAVESSTDGSFDVIRFERGTGSPRTKIADISAALGLKPGPGKSVIFQDVWFDGPDSLKVLVLAEPWPSMPIDRDQEVRRQRRVRLDIRLDTRLDSEEGRPTIPTFVRESEGQELRPSGLGRKVSVDGGRLHIIGRDGDYDHELSKKVEAALQAAEFQVRSAWRARDGSLAVAGSFESRGSTSRFGVLKLTSEGVIDSGFRMSPSK